MHFELSFEFRMMEGFPLDSMTAKKESLSWEFEIFFDLLVIILRVAVQKKGQVFNIDYDS